MKMTNNKLNTVEVGSTIRMKAIPDIEFYVSSIHYVAGTQDVSSIGIIYENYDEDGDAVNMYGADTVEIQYADLCENFTVDVTLTMDIDSDQE